MIVRDLTLTHEQLENIKQLGRPLTPRPELLADIRRAVSTGSGYGFGRIGMSQKHWMYYPILLGQPAANPKVFRVYEARLIKHGLKHEGVFPPDPAFYLRYNNFYMEHVHNLDCIGLYLNSWDIVLEKPILNHFGINNKIINYVDLHPDRVPPANDQNCYLPLFRDRRILIVCPFASLLQSRANQETFEGVWSKIGKKWFYPTDVQALDIPYGFSADTHARYPTSLEMFDDICREIERREFDVALIGAGGLAIPIASHIKQLGKVGLDLGGHLQMVFGVIGKKWRNLEDWQTAYYNDWWIHMPERYKPKEQDVCYESDEPGAFW